MKKIVALGITLAIAMLAGCSSGLDRKFDGTSEKGFESSLADMKKSAKPDEVARLDDALLALAVTDVSIGYEGGIVGALRKISARSPEQLADVLMPIVNGKTGRDIIAAGRKRKADEGLHAVHCDHRPRVTQLRFVTAPCPPARTSAPARKDPVRHDQE